MQAAIGASMQDEDAEMARAIAASMSATAGGNVELSVNGSAVVNPGPADFQAWPAIPTGTASDGEKSTPLLYEPLDLSVSCDQHPFFHY